MIEGKDVCIGEINGTKIYLKWQDVKDICTDGVSMAYEQVRLKNKMMVDLLKECRDEIDYLRKHYKGNIDHFKNNTRLDKEINEVLK